MTARAVLDGIKAQLAAATPGPWTWSPELDIWGDCGPNLETVERGPVYSDGSQGAAVTVIGSWGHDANGISVEDADASFIAAAPGNIERLTNALEAVLAECDYLDTLADGDKHYAAGFRKLIENALETKEPQ